MTRALLLALVLLAPALAGAQTKVTTKQARTAAPASVNHLSTSSGEGVSKSFARADHAHAVTTASMVLPTCAAGLEGLKRWPTTTGGTGTSSRTRVCVCTSDGAASPTYAWVNSSSGTVGTASTCPP